MGGGRLGGGSLRCHFVLNFLTGRQDDLSVLFNGFRAALPSRKVAAMAGHKRCRDEADGREEVSREELRDTLRRRREEAYGRKEGNRQVMHDTIEMCRSDTYLKAVKRQHACALPGLQPREARESVPGGVEDEGLAEVRDSDCVVVARELSEVSSARVWMLNMACASRPGGGALQGCNAQEEHLCRCTNLYPDLRRAYDKGWYPLHSGDEGVRDVKVLVHEGIVVFKDPEDYSLLPRSQWFEVGVLTAVAEKVHGRRALGPNAFRLIDFLLDVAEMQDCTHLVLSAWGCGAFRQSLVEVARCFHGALAHRGKRMTVVFAIKDDHNSEGNLHAFRTVFGQRKNAR